MRYLKTATIRELAWPVVGVVCYIALVLIIAATHSHPPQSGLLTPPGAGLITILIVISLKTIYDWFSEWASEEQP